ncbi:MAG: hypothetical protein HG424_000285 [candidate division SR1 bacterium]|nr:hypothetical protein [candidate division SR1 bacterium]
MESYLGLGLNSSSFLNPELLTPELLTYFKQEEKPEYGLRFKNTPNFNLYCEGKFLDPLGFEQLGEKDYLIEEFFLSLRTDSGVKNLKKYEKILVSNYIVKIEAYREQGLLIGDEDGFVLTDEGMDVFNAIVTDIMAEI